ncbi:unnamed protein product [Discula destructiva]
MLSSAVIVGGSLSGLLHGLHLKRMGINVTILEQDANSERSSHNAGIQISDNVKELLRLDDETGRDLTVGSCVNQWSIGMRKEVFRGASIRYWTNWGLVYRVLRANFDGYTSQACPDAPDARAPDGKAQYLTGMRVTGLEHKDGLATVHFVNQTGKEDSITTELVIGADGARSTIRKLVQAPTAEMEGYAGFFAWRGAVPRKMVSKETADYFQDSISLQLMGGRMYILCYTIPTDDACFDSDELLLNWLVYHDVTEGSPEETALLTDVKGQYHKTTVPQGLTDPTLWKSHRQTLANRLLPPFVEIVTKSPTPFLTKINESLGGQAVFHDGRVLLVGDALTSYRPNLGRATDQAASHALSLGRVLRGEIPFAAWNLETCHEAKRVFLLSRVMSESARGTWLSFGRAIASYVWFGLMSKVWKAKLLVQYCTS